MSNVQQFLVKAQAQAIKALDALFAQGYDTGDAAFDKAANELSGIDEAIAAGEDKQLQRNVSSRLEEMYLPDREKALNALIDTQERMSKGMGFINKIKESKAQALEAYVWATDIDKKFKLPVTYQVRASAWDRYEEEKETSKDILSRAWDKWWGLQSHSQAIANSVFGLWGQYYGLLNEELSKYWTKGESREALPTVFFDVGHRVLMSRKDETATPVSQRTETEYSLYKAFWGEMERNAEKAKFNLSSWDEEQAEKVESLALNHVVAEIFG